MQVGDLDDEGGGEEGEDGDGRGGDEVDDEGEMHEHAMPYTLPSSGSESPSPRSSLSSDENPGLSAWLSDDYSTDEPSPLAFPVEPLWNLPGARRSSIHFLDPIYDTVED